MTDFILNCNPETDGGIIALIDKIGNKEQVSFSTSGTTGEPKKICHSYKFLTKNIKIDPKYKSSIWGLTYPANKIAGSQVVLQALLNEAYIVNLFNKPLSEVPKIINDYNVTHISATPTFYRLLFHNKFIFKKVIQVTLGGEVANRKIIEQVKTYFPNAKICNIYASTEYGTLFTSDSDCFELSKQASQLVKINDNEIVVRHNNKWMRTGDLVEWINDSKFRIIGRNSNLINVGGYIVNPLKVESIINDLNYVQQSYVYKIKNSVLGTVIAADIVLNKNKEINLIKKDLKTKLENYELPLKINIVESLNLTETSKLSRS